MPPEPSRRLPFKILLATFFALTIFYHASARPVLRTNDGSQFALAAAIAHEHRFAINSYIEYTLAWDYAFRNGNYYSDRAPGLSLLGVPFLHLAAIERMILGPEPDPNGLPLEPREIRYALLVPALFGSATVILLILTLLRLGVTELSAAMCGISFAVGSLHWKYATMFMSHGPAEFFVLAPIYILLSANFASSTRRQSLFLFLSSAACLLRIELGLLIPFYLLLYWNAMHSAQGDLKKDAFIKLGCLALPLFTLAFYQALCFGAPWNTFTSFYSPSRNYWGSDPGLARGGAFPLSSMFLQPLMSGLFKIFVQWPGDPNLSVVVPVAGRGAWGVMVLQPVLWLSLIGWVMMLKTGRTFERLLFGIVLTLVLFSALNMSVDGGDMRDPRYVIPILPLLFLPLGTTIDRFRDSRFLELVKGVFYFLTAVGIFVCAVHQVETGFTAGRFPLREAIDLQSVISKEAAAALIRELFPAPMQPLFPLVVLAAVVIAVRQIFRALKQEIRDSAKRIPFGGGIVAVNGILAALSVYATLNPINSLNLWSDTIRAGRVPATLAAQWAGLPEAIAPKEYLPSTAPCTEGIYVRGVSAIKFPVPPEAKLFEVIPHAQPEISVRGQPNLEFHVLLDGREASGNAKSSSSEPLAISLSGAHEVELQTVHPVPNAEVYGAWCSPHFS